MLHQMKLNEEPFRKIQNGTKTIELRLNDEKRQNVRVGDFIGFSLVGDERKQLQTRVTGLHTFGSFQELYAALPKEQLGFAADETPDPGHMEQFYSKEAQEKYGALGIELRVTQLQRFLDAQNYGYDFGETYATALAEMKKGRKIEHWIWYVFPQICGLGKSDTSVYFSIHDFQEAVDYYEHPVLGARLTEISSELLHIRTDDPMVVFGDPDAFKVRSCMTLFKYVAPDNDMFQRVLDKFCRSIEDDKTLEQLKKLK